MSRDPSSPMMRGWDAYKEPTPPPPKPNPLRKPQPPRRRPPRVRVENAGKDKAINKLLTTTEALSAEERRIVRGYRLSSGGEAERLARMQIELDVLKEKDKR